MVFDLIILEFNLFSYPKEERIRELHYVKFRDLADFGGGVFEIFFKNLSGFFYIVALHSLENSSSGSFFLYSPWYFLQVEL